MLLRGSWNTLANNFDNKDVDNVMENSSTSDQNIMLAIEVEDDNGDSLSTTDDNDGEQRIIERLILQIEYLDVLPQYTFTKIDSLKVPRLYQVTVTWSTILP